MWDYDEEIIERAKKENMEFCHLWKEHQNLEKKLEVLSKLRFPTPEEELEKKRLQKVKLRGKDRMGEILKRWKEEIQIPAGK